MKKVFFSLFFIFLGFAQVAFAGNDYQDTFLENQKMYKESHAPIQKRLDQIKVREKKIEETAVLLLRKALKERNKEVNPNAQNCKVVMQGGMLYVADREGRLDQVTARWLTSTAEVIAQMKEYELFCKETQRIEVMWNVLYQRALAIKYSFAVPTDEALNTIKKWTQGTAGVVELGAGSGYWAHLISQQKVNVVAFDNFSWTYPATDSTFQVPVREGDEQVLKDYADHVLLLCFPPKGPMAANALKNFSGNRLIFIGELSRGETMANSEFEAILQEDFEQVEALELPNWPGMNVRLYVFNRAMNRGETKTEVLSSEQSAQLSALLASHAFTQNTTQASSQAQLLCQSCGAAGDAMKKCSACHSVSYCKKECQKADWKKHKLNCGTKNNNPAAAVTSSKSTKNQTQSR